MTLYCIALKQNDTDQFLVEAENEQRAIEILEAEIASGGTPDSKRYAGGAMGHTVNDYRVMRKNDPIDQASWNIRTGGVVEVHNQASRFGANELALLVRDNVIFRCEHCVGGDLPVYHGVHATMTLDDIRECLDKRSHRGLATSEGDNA